MTKVWPDERGRFGEYGGRYVPETLMNALIELEQEYRRHASDPDFQEEVRYWLRQYSGRPTPLYYAERLSKESGGAKIYLKREDLNHTGAHKINNTIGQAVLAKRMGKKKYRRNRRRTAWCCHGNCSGAARDGMQSVYGRRGYEAATAQCFPHENARGGSDSCHLRDPHLERRWQ